VSTSSPNSIEEAAIVRRNNSSQHNTSVLHGDDDEQLLPLSAQQFQSKKLYDGVMMMLGEITGRKS
jgi:hypothetical protein